MEKLAKIIFSFFMIQRQSFILNDYSCIYQFLVHPSVIHSSNHPLFFWEVYDLNQEICMPSDLQEMRQCFIGKVGPLLNFLALLLFIFHLPRCLEEEFLLFFEFNVVAKICNSEKGDSWKCVFVFFQCGCQFRFPATHFQLRSHGSDYSSLETGQLQSKIVK